MEYMKNVVRSYQTLHMVIKWNPPNSNTVGVKQPWIWPNLKKNVSTKASRLNCTEFQCVIAWQLLKCCIPSMVKVFIFATEKELVGHSQGAQNNLRLTLGVPLELERHWLFIRFCRGWLYNLHVCYKKGSSHTLCRATPKVDRKMWASKRNGIYTL